MTPVEYLLVALVALQALDLILTVAILRRGGVERNPLVRWMQEQFGVVFGTTLVKLLVVGVFLVVSKSVPIWFLALLVALHAGVVLHNARELVR